jgi:hypothetical protein
MKFDRYSIWTYFKNTKNPKIYPFEVIEKYIFFKLLRNIGIFKLILKYS